MHVNTVLRDYFLEFGEDVNVDANKPLLRAGEVAKYLYLIQSGAVRLCVRNAEGAETTVQFFFEDDMVCSLESMLSGCPSGLELITMEACQLRVLDRDTVLTKFQSHATMPSELLALTQQRLVEYINLYTIAIAQTPTQRYQAMLVSQPDKLARIPLHILASYLGVTPVHLSRIRRRLKSGPGSRAF
ncbi:cyclic nucleotide-binding domain protein [Burkholderia multivorans]|uniref:Cyclic nucleotide-binding domain protein n=2 Tax=Burkholderia multivorans TaxID=87883 RepID=A0ABD7L889_9BURK|nr:Crp/Fnr family transcriptional regulator [Burkholderia multivorans]SAJ93636.1 cyclic nucleotide-binding domain protein [Burkholderia multivorans]SAJ98993.1 cyclic nucleotide-binding domain protein [Burkholderia multivorans]HEF5153647.1 Crp/Fnr family transcriptional regulator [Burkholderia multivorans]HEF5157043.1 Crp/Fnr family transcriptional regulator [Burkholderia multivorans]